MKERDVMLHLKVKTDIKLPALRRAINYGAVSMLPYSFKVLHAQANVIAAKKDTTRRKR